MPQVITLEILFNERLRRHQLGTDIGENPAHRVKFSELDEILGILRVVNLLNTEVSDAQLLAYYEKMVKENDDMHKKIWG